MTIVPSLAICNKNKKRKHHTLKDIGTVVVIEICQEIKRLNNEIITTM